MTADRDKLLNRELQDSELYFFKWLHDYLDDKNVEPLDKNKLRIFFKSCGANEDIGPTLKDKFSSRHYGNKARSSAMKAVWGEKYLKYRDFCDKYVNKYEEETKKALPQVEFPHEGGQSTFSKTEGMRGFLSDLTAYAFANDGEYDFEVFDLITQARLRRKTTDTKDERCRITIKGYNKDKATGVEKPFEPASFPADFPITAMRFVRSWSFK